MFDSIKSFFADVIYKALEWLMDLILWAPRKLYAEFLDQILQFFMDVAPPSFIDYAKDYMGQLGPVAGYFFDVGQFNWGFQLVLTAMALKFGWNKIPFLGK